jgi:hypothetical protein
MQPNYEYHFFLTLHQLALRHRLQLLARTAAAAVYGTHVTPCVNKSDTGVTPLHSGIFNESDEGIINFALG